MSMATQEGKRFSALDSLRGVFSLCVIFFHSPEYSVLNDNFVIRNAYLFVDFFFVLSGFVMIHTYGGKLLGRDQLVGFFKKRFLRLYPLLLYTTIVYFLFRTAGVLIEYKKISAVKDLLPDLLDTLFLCNSTPLFGSGHGMNYPSWSISAEAIAYIIFGMMIFFFRKNTILAGLLIVIGAAASLYWLGKGDMIFSKDYGFLRGAYGFFVGTLTYKVWSVANRVTARFRYWTIVELLYVMLLVAFFYRVDHDRTVTIFTPVYFGLGILIFAVSNGLLNKFFNTSLPRYFGVISYSIYLNHAVVILAITLILHKIRIPLPGYVLSFVAPVITVLYSALTYRLIEKRFYFSSKAKRPTVIAHQEVSEIEAFNSSIGNQSF